jgi:hypothetical protein
MTTYRIVAIGEAREIYEVEAENEEDAQAKFAVGRDIRGPFLTEVSGSQIEEIEPLDDARAGNV